MHNRETILVKLAEAKKEKPLGLPKTLAAIAAGTLIAHGINRAVFKPLFKRYSKLPRKTRNKMVPYMKVLGAGTAAGAVYAAHKKQKLIREALGLD